MKNFKKLSRNELKTVTGGKVWIAETSCGIIATTTQDWSPEQANEWRDKIEANYCQSGLISPDLA
jgi:bacteriocin-like protein